MRRLTLCLVAVVFLVGLSVTVRGQDAAPAVPAPTIDETKTPWLKGVNIPPFPPDPSPVVPSDISRGEGGPLPATLTEDVGILLNVNSPIFDEKPPTVWKETQLPKGEWTGQPSVRWFFEDVKKNKATLASCSEILPSNQMKVTPLDPTEYGAVTVTLARPMKYEIAPDRFKTCFVNSSKAFSVAIGDTTPPTCGLEISVDGQSSTFWTVENPTHKSPPPRMADVMCKGPLFVFPQSGEEATVSGLELGSRMIVPDEQAQLKLPKKGKAKIQVVLADNFSVDEKTVKFGISNGAGEAPVPVGPANPAELDLSTVPATEKPYLFIEASDPSGNKQVLYVPVKFE